MIDLFIEKHKHLEISYVDFLQTHFNLNNLHNWTIPNLFLYFSLEQYITKHKVHFYPGAVFFNNKRSYKWFCYWPFEVEVCKLFDFSDLDEVELKRTSFYTTNLLQDSNLTKSKFKETIYEIAKIFDLNSYKEIYKDQGMKIVRKKYYNRVSRPLKFIEELGERFQVKDITDEMFSEIEQLHEEWCKYKLADPKTFKMMFSSNRYFRCIKESFTCHFISNPQVWYRRAFYLDNKLIAIRQCLLDKNTSYDIGFFSRFWDIPSNLVNYINTYCMMELMEQGIQFHNCGNELDKNLKRFKEHFPHIEKWGYKYNFKK